MELVRGRARKGHPGTRDISWRNQVRVLGNQGGDSQIWGLVQKKGREYGIE